MPLSAIEARFAELQATQERLVIEVHELTEITREVQELRLAERRNRRGLRFLAFGGVVLLLLVTAGLTAALLTRVDALLDRQSDATLSTCLQRNESTARVRLTFQRLAKEEEDEQLRTVWATLGRTLGASPTDCSQIAAAK